MPLSTVLGMLFALTLLLFAVQVLLSLYARSVVSGAAFDAARVVATGSDDARPAAEARVNALIGSLEPRLDWSGSTADEVVLHVEAAGPRLFGSVPALSELGELRRTVRVRREHLR